LLQQASLNMKQCFSKYQQDALKYAGRFETYGSCTAEAEKLNEAASNIKLHLPKQDQLKLQQHIRVVVNGEAYFKKLAKQRVSAWNTRDNHMLQTIKSMLEFYGPHSKIIVWAHNTHIGDAHYSYMTMQGKTNIGELLRKEFGNEHVFIAGFGSYTGTVTTADSWGGIVHVVNVPPAQKDSWEERLHSSGNGSKYIRCRDLRNAVPLLKWMPQRALGAIYQPEKDSQVYVPSVIPWRYDAFIFIDETHALHPLKTAGMLNRSGMPVDD
jgi:erythromycin esterase